MSDWSANQWQLIEWLAQPRFERTPPTEEMLAERLGVTTRTLRRWKQEPGFQDEVNRLARQSIGKKLPELYGALIREAEKGSYQHLQLAFEMCGDYTRTQRNLNTSDMKGDIIIRFVEEEVAADDDV